jgi:hypothetical protein
VVNVTVSHLHPSLIFAGKDGAYPSGSSEVRILASPANIRLRQRKWLIAENTQAYYEMELIEAVNSLIVDAPSWFEPRTV